MRMLRAVTVRAGVFLALALGAAACAGQAPDSAASRVGPSRPGELLVGTTPNYPPIIFKQGGEIQGVEADLARRLALNLRLRLTFVELPWPRLLPSLLDGSVDVVMAGMSVTPERSALVSFTRPYLQVGQMALIRRQDVGRLAGQNAMAAPGRRIGVEEGSTGEKYVVTTFTAARVVRYRSPDEGVRALKAGDLDYLIHDAPTVWRLAGDPEHQEAGLMGLYIPLTVEYLAFAVRKGDEALRSRLDSELSRLSERGELSVILRRWIPVQIEVNPAPRS
jgi:ABC-type amino acid transport substrate-binding protein